MMGRIGEVEDEKKSRRKGTKTTKRRKKAQETMVLGLQLSTQNGVESSPMEGGDNSLHID
jgi:hypothetical protein